MGVLNKMRADVLPCQNAFDPNKTNRQVIEIIWARMHGQPTPAGSLGRAHKYFKPKYSPG